MLADPVEGRRQPEQHGEEHEHRRGDGQELLEAGPRVPAGYVDIGHGTSVPRGPKVRSTDAPEAGAQADQPGPSAAALRRRWWRRVKKMTVIATVVTSPEMTKEARGNSPSASPIS